MAERAAARSGAAGTRLAVDPARGRASRPGAGDPLGVRCDDARPGSAGAEGGRCLQILADLLHCGWPGEAERCAARLIDEFGSLASVLAADPAALGRCLGDGGEAVAAFIATVRGAQIHALRRELEDGPLLPTSAALLDYLHADMALAADEEFRVLYLNSRNRLLRDETVARGTPNEVTVHPRTIVKRALELSATAIILVHNHPSGRPDPSQSDIQTTARIVRAARTLDIVVHDHIIIARTGWRSFRQSGLLV